MINIDEFNIINEEYNVLLRDKAEMYSKIWFRLLVIHLNAVLLLRVFVPAVLTVYNTFVLISGIITLIIIALIIISKNYKSEKPFYDFLIRRIIDDINREVNELSYTPYPKNLKHINKEGGLFHSSCSSSVKGCIENVNDNSKILINIMLYTSDGKTTVQHFKGNYLVAYTDTAENFQIRTNSRPILNGCKLKRIDKENEFKIYVEEENINKSYDNYVELVKEWKERLSANKIYLGFVDNQIHLAYESPDNKKPKDITYETYTDIYNKLYRDIQLLDEIKKIKA